MVSFSLFKAFENTSFKEIQDIMDKHGLRVNGVIKLISKVTECNQVKIKQDIINGTLCLSNDELVRINIFLEHFQDFDFYKYFKDNAFITAFLPHILIKFFSAVKENCSGVIIYTFLFLSINFFI